MKFFEKNFQNRLHYININDKSSSEKAVEYGLSQK